MLRWRKRTGTEASSARKARDLLDRVVTGLFGVGLSLQSAADLPDEKALPQIADALQHMDDIVAEIRDDVFAETGRGGQPGGAPPNGAR